jgi:hypothetical protein
MNLSRSNNVVNICATQSYAWIVEVIGREAANVYISAFGVQFWLQQTDPETCRRASEICGRITREKVSAEHNFNFAGFIGALGAGRAMTIRHRVGEEERERFRPEDFAQLNVGDIIAYNKGRTGRTAKVAKGRAAYIFCTERPAGLEAVNRRVREYYREVIENLAHERGQDSRWECAPRPAAIAAPPKTAPAAPAFISPALVQAERADFKAHLGNLDAAVGGITGVQPRAVAIAIEEARGRAEDFPHPAAQFGKEIRMGFGGMASGACSPAEEVPPGAGGLPYSGDLKAQLAGQAAHARALKASADRTAVRRAASRPNPGPLAFGGKSILEAVGS